MTLSTQNCQIIGDVNLSKKFPPPIEILKDEHDLKNLCPHTVRVLPFAFFTNRSEHTCDKLRHLTRTWTSKKKSTQTTRKNMTIGIGSLLKDVDKRNIDIISAIMTNRRRSGINGFLQNEFIAFWTTCATRYDFIFWGYCSACLKFTKTKK